MERDNNEHVATGITPGAEFVGNILGLLDAHTIDDGNVDYKKLYYYLFNGITDVLAGAKTHSHALQGLMDLQRCSEELFCRLSEAAGESA